MDVLLHARFEKDEEHSGKRDTVGYVTKAWTPWAMLVDVDAEVRDTKMIGAHFKAAQHAIQAAFAPQERDLRGQPERAGMDDSEQTQTA